MRTTDIVEENNAELEDDLGVDVDDDDEGDGEAEVRGAVSSGGAYLHNVEFCTSLLRRMCQDHASIRAELRVNHYPEIIRIAVSLINLLVLPDTDVETVMITKSAVLFASCTEVLPAVVPFHLFQATANCDVQWHDVVHVRNMAGLGPEDFFLAAAPYAANFMVTVALHPPSAVWDFTRLPDWEAHLSELKAKRRESFSPDHTAAMVVLEFLCAFHHDDEEPLQQWAENTVPQRFKEMPKLLVGNRTRVCYLLNVFAEVLRIPSLEFAEMLLLSGFFSSGQCLYFQVLKSEMSLGRYSLPLCRRLSHAVSPWEVVYSALNSSDRYVILRALRVFAAGLQSVSDNKSEVALLAAILRAHGSTSSVLFRYCLRVDDDRECGKGMKGLYFCSRVTPRDATYTGFSGTKSLAFTSSTKDVTLYHAAHPVPKRAPSIGMVLIPSVVAQIESPTAKTLIEVVACRQGMDHWSDAVAKLETLAFLRRRMRVQRTPDDWRSVLLEVVPLLSTSRCQQANEANTLLNLTPDSGEPEAAELRSAITTAQLLGADALQGVSDSDIVRACVQLQYQCESVQAPPTHDADPPSTLKQEGNASPLQPARLSFQVSRRASASAAARRSLSSMVSMSTNCAHSIRGVKRKEREEAGSPTKTAPLAQEAQPAGAVEGATSCSAVDGLAKAAQALPSRVTLAEAPALRGVLTQIMRSFLDAGGAAGAQSGNATAACHGGACAGVPPQAAATKPPFSLRIPHIYCIQLATLQ